MAENLNQYKNKIVGLIMAGGSGTRLSPITKYLNKHLIPVFDKPMIFYSLSLMILNKIKEVIIVTNKDDVKYFKKILKKGENYGIKIYYVQQNKSNGIPEGLKLSPSLIKNRDVFMILGDNILFGSGMSTFFEHIWSSQKSIIYPYIVKDPARYGVVEFNQKGIKNLIEKPKKFISEWIVTGLYFIKNKDIKFVSQLKKSKRKEYEITDFLNLIRKKSKLDFKKISRGYSWNDVGTYNSLLESSNLIFSIQNKQGLEISSPDEIAYRKKLINKKQFFKNIKEYQNSPYAEYLLSSISKDRKRDNFE
jgi:glucose-1-phosphate thymidylyltransferase